jgi:hypothetical protein
LLQRHEHYLAKPNQRLVQFLFELAGGLGGFDSFVAIRFPEFRNAAAQRPSDAGESSKAEEDQDVSIALPASRVFAGFEDLREQ